jgi:ABC-2 type transport system permease protein
MYVGRTLWTSLVALPFFAAYFILGVIMMISRSNNYAAIYNQTQDILYGEKLSAVERIVGMHSILWIMVAGTAIMFALQGFSYVFNSSQIDFYLSQPTTRAQRIRKNYLNAHGTFLFMYVGCLIISLIIAAAMGAVNCNVLLSALIECARSLVLFFAFYNMTVLAVMLSGSLPIAVLLSMGFMFVSIVLSGELMVFKTIFFATYSGYEPFRVYLSPLYDRIAALTDLGAQDSLGSLLKESGYVTGAFLSIWRRDADVLVVGLIAFVAVIIFARFRRAEWAGSSIPLRPFRWFIKILVSVLVGLGAGIFVYILYETVWNSRLYLMMSVIMVLATILTGCVTEVILEGNIRRMFKGMAQTVMAIAIVLLTFVIFRGDLLGFDSFVPAADKVESCAFLTYYDSFNYHSDLYGSDYEYDASKFMEITDIEAVTAIARAGMETQRASAKKSQEGIYENDGFDLTILYRMKNGKKIYRHVTIPYDVVDDSLDRVVSSEEYKKGAFIVFHDDNIRNIFKASRNRTLSYVTPTASLEVKDFDYELISEAYRKDILANYNYKEIKDKIPVASIELSVNDEDYLYGSLEVYDNFTNTITLMKQYGIYSKGVVESGDVKQIVVTNYYPGYDLETQDQNQVPDDLENSTATYTEPEQIKAILEGTIYNGYYTQWFNYNNSNPQYSVEVILNGDTYGGSYYAFLKGKVPGFVAEDTNN